MPHLQFLVRFYGDCITAVIAIFNAGAVSWCRVSLHCSARSIAVHCSSGCNAHCNAVQQAYCWHCSATVIALSTLVMRMQPIFLHNYMLHLLFLKNTLQFS